ncbi:MAG: invasion associated locus B family protein [Chromatiaceae bacterium]|nr:invasion associated locus B family protein [Chromatiaceae bacterium]
MLAATQFSFGIAASSIANAAERQRQWSLARDNQIVALLDCEDCGDDVGAVLLCQDREPALLSLLWAAVDSEEPLTGPLRLEAGGQVFERFAETAYAGQIGQIPQIPLGPDDPLLPALKAANDLTITFAGIKITMSLRGFTASFDEFDRVCPWRRDLASTTEDGSHVDGQGAADVLDSAPRWMLTEYSDAVTGAAIASLSFGIPQTDAIAFTATCAARQPGARIDVLALVDPGDRPEADAIDLVVGTADFELRIAGEVSTGLTTYPGVRAAITPQHPLWSTLQVAETVTLSADDGPGLDLPALRSSVQIERFLRACSGF